MAIPLVRLVLLHGAVAIGLVASSAVAQTPTASPAAFYGGDCGTLWSAAQGNMRDAKALSADMHWAALKQLEKKECLKAESKKAPAQSLASAAEQLVSDEVKQRVSDERILLHLTDLSSAQISAKSYDDVVATYQRMVPRLQESQAVRRFRSKQLWFDYVEMVVASSFANNKIDEGLKIAESELKADAGTPAALQGRFAAKIGDLLLSRVRVKDALRFYALALQFDKSGDRAQRALYWQTLDLYRRGDVKAAREMFVKFKEAATESELKARIPVLQSVVASEVGVQVEKNAKDPEFIKVWRDIHLVGQQ